MSDEAKPKMWLLRTNDVNVAECRVPKPGEHYFGVKGLTVYKAPDDFRITAPCVILEPISPDTVMVPREMIEALKAASIRLRHVEDGHCTHSHLSLNGNKPRCWLKEVIDDILDCAKPVEPKDEILDVLLGERETCVSEIRFARPEFRATSHEWENAHQKLARIERAIELREAELKARKA